MLIGLAAGWMPACLGLIALWAGFYRGRGAGPLRSASPWACVAVCAVLGRLDPGARRTGPAPWGPGASPRSGCCPSSSPSRRAASGSSIDSSFRLPVLIAYLALVIVTMIWPAEKNLAELIALSAALLVASQFWYLDKGGTLVLLYLPWPSS